MPIGIHALLLTSTQQQLHFPSPRPRDDDETQIPFRSRDVRSHFRNTGEKKIFFSPSFCSWKWTKEKNKTK
jgi:hypothetical protein